MSRRLFNAPPAAGFVHPKVAGRPRGAGEHSYNLDTASDAAPNYLRWVADLVRPHLGASVLEVGSGIGAITEHLAQGRRLVATDVSEECVAALHHRFDNSPNVQVVHADLRSWEPDETFESIVMINVLEHIEDDAGALRSLSRFLRPEGSMVIYVPALNGLFGDFDFKVGHFRRYSRWRLKGVMHAAGLQPGETRYANMLAIPAWLAFTRFAEVDPEGAKALPIWDRLAVPTSRFIESRARAPLGLNLLGVGTRRP
jgi:SAM-dependent methyltransferase